MEEFSLTDGVAFVMGAGLGLEKESFSENILNAKWWDNSNSGQQIDTISSTQSYASPKYWYIYVFKTAFLIVIDNNVDIATEANPKVNGRK